MHRTDTRKLFPRLFRIGLGQDSISRGDQQGVLTSIRIESILAALPFDQMFQMGNVFQLDCCSNPLSITGQLCLSSKEFIGVLKGGDGAKT